MKMSVHQGLRTARALSREGDAAGAQRVLNEILDRFPGNRRVADELQALLRPRIANAPRAQLDWLVSLYNRGQIADVDGQAAGLLATYPDCEILRNIAGAVAAALGRHDDALAHYDHAVALAPDFAEAHNNRGNALRELDRADEAVAAFDAALAIRPDYAEAHLNRGIALRTLRRLGEAQAATDRALALMPDLAQAYNSRGTILADLYDFDAALQAYDAALRLCPGLVEAHVNRGNTLKQLARREDAVESYDRAIALAPGLADAHYNRGFLLKELKRADEALASLARAVELKPDHAVALSEKLYLEAHMCLWTDGAERDGLRAMALAGAPVPPFHMLALEDNAEHQLAYARHWTRAQFGAGRPATFAKRAADAKIRIGYFSADFHNHATMALMIRMLELHDKARFEVHAFSYGPAVEDRMRKRVVTAVDGFHDIRNLSDEAAAALARDAGIDIAVDLKGHTETARGGILAHRAAPCQISYLGYPGTMGADYIDWLVADRIVVPEDRQHHYAEKIAYLPNSYQVNDSAREISGRTYTRAELGLPRDGFVFACHNNNYKITPAEYDVWMRLLARVEGSVLWLLEDNRWAADNLRREAAARGIDPARIVFAERVPMREHLARQRCADLFLDTFAVNAHTTASDALWAGLPVLTMAGDSFVARVAASLLHAVGLPELVTETVGDYESLALALATDPARLRDLRARLEANRAAAPLFDTAGFTRDMEALYERLHSAP